jgi:hypothetical protein
MWTRHSRIKIDKTTMSFKTLKTYIYIKKFQCTWLTNISFYDVLLFTFYFDTTLTFFWVHIFHFFYVTNLVLSFQSPLQVHNLFRIHPKRLWWFQWNFMITRIMKKVKMLILNMVLNFMFVCNLKKIHVW